jgi:hypothetical protein
MLTQTIREHFLVDELQLGQRLNDAVHQEQRSYFSLLLSMLSTDVLDQPEFSSPTIEPVPEIDWRKRWDLPPAAVLDSSRCSADESYFRSVLLHEGGIEAVHLFNAAQPDPLSWRQFAIPADVWNELPPLKQEKYRQQHQLDYQTFDETPDAMMQTLETFNYTQELKVDYFYR